MSDSENEEILFESSISLEEKEEENSHLNFGENTPASSEVISSNLRKKRTATVTLLNETSKENKKKQGGKARRTDGGTSSSESPTDLPYFDQIDVVLNEDGVIIPVEKSEPASVVAKASDIVNREVAWVVGDMCV